MGHRAFSRIARTCSLPLSSKNVPALRARPSGQQLAGQRPSPPLDLFPAKLALDYEIPRRQSPAAPRSAATARRDALPSRSLDYAAECDGKARPPALPGAFFDHEPKPDSTGPGRPPEETGVGESKQAAGRTTSLFRHRARTSASLAKHP